MRSSPGLPPVTAGPRAAGQAALANHADRQTGGQHRQRENDCSWLQMERSGTDYTRTRTQTTVLAAAPRDYCRTATGLGDRRGVPVLVVARGTRSRGRRRAVRLSRRRQTMERRQFVKLSGLAGLGAVVPGERVAAQAPGPSARSTGPLLGCQRGPTDVRRLQYSNGTASITSAAIPRTAPIRRAGRSSTDGSARSLRGAGRSARHDRVPDAVVGIDRHPDAPARD